MKSLFIYFADPMCSWCWGFSPVVDRLRERFAQDFEMSLVLGGLAQGESRSWDKHTRGSIRSHWEHVNELSGQPFDMSFFDRESFVYNTEPACRAVVAVRTIAAGTEFRYLAALHEAFYVGNRDITQTPVLREVAESCGCAGEEFVAAFDDPETMLKTGNDFALTQQARIRGFPALLVGEENSGFTTVTLGYQAYEPIETTITDWLSERENLVTAT